MVEYNINSIIQPQVPSQQMNTRPESDIVSEILIIKKRIYVESTELDSFLQYLDQAVFKRGFLFCGPARITETPEFMRAFNSLSSVEKADYYLCCLKIVQELLKKEELPISSSEQSSQYEIIYRLNKSKDWVPTTMVISNHTGSVCFQSLDKTIKLQHYIIRYSKCKERNAFVLECSVGKSSIETIRISHSNYVIFEDLQAKVKSHLVHCLRERLFHMMNIKKKVNEMPMKSMLKKRESISVEIFKGKERKSLRELIQQSNANLNFTIEDYKAISHTLVDRTIIANLDHFEDYEELSKDVFIHTSKHRVKKVYYFDQTEFSKQWIVDQLSKYENFKIWKASLFMISLLASIPAEKTQIFHEINMYKDSTECDYVYLRHYFTEGEKSYFIDKSIQTVEYGSHENSNSRGNIEYCIWRISESQKKATIQVIVECELSHVGSPDIYDTVCEQIGEFEKIVLCKEAKCSQIYEDSVQFKDNELQAISFDENKDFTSYEGISIRLPNDRDVTEFYSIYSGVNKDNSDNSDQQLWEIETKSNSSKRGGEKYHYQLKPETPKAKVYKTMKNGQFFDHSECIVNEQGDLLFVNQEKVKAQSSVLKSVLKKIGTNIFSGKSILNVSLPIEIFSADTNLERICKGNAYAPIFLQNKVKATPLERMKAVIAYSLGNILLYIEMAKPFNPILGETYQGYVDGCPIYGEQISHHPPITSLYMVGRGYFIHASLQAKIQFGLNNVSGINEGCYNVAFHESNPRENVISFLSPPGELSGVIIGDRKLTLNSKTRYFDSKNQLFCEIAWGRNKSHKQTNFSDYMQGKIVKLAKQQTEIGKIKVSKQDEVLGTISGRWTQKVIFDVNKTTPFAVFEEPHPLESDGKFRKDRMLVSQKKLGEAQIAKEELEQLQRKDRKLRKEHK